MPSIVAHAIINLTMTPVWAATFLTVYVIGGLMLRRRALAAVRNVSQARACTVRRARPACGVGIRYSVTTGRPPVICGLSRCYSWPADLRRRSQNTPRLRRQWRPRLVALLRAKPSFLGHGPRQLRVGDVANRCGVYRGTQMSLVAAARCRRSVATVAKSLSFQSGSAGESFNGLFDGLRRKWSTTDE